MFSHHPWTFRRPISLPTTPATLKTHPLSLVAAVCLANACNIGVSQTRGAQAPTAAPAPAVTEICPGGIAPAPNGLIEDFEDTDGQLIVAEGRDGDWWFHHDPHGSTIAPSKLEPSPGGANDTANALHLQGSLSSSKEAYGSSVGVNFSREGTYDASRYKGVSFMAKATGDSTKQIRLKIGDSNTHPDAGDCTSCWNHFGKDFTLTSEWQPYTVLFAEARQVPGWGQPRPPAITPEKLQNLDWTIDKGTSFDLWIDEVQFVVCQ